MGKYLLSIDQGTTSTKVIIFDIKGNQVVKKQKKCENICIKPGYVEQNVEQIYEDVVLLINECMSFINIDVEDIVGFGITNQRETTIVWDKLTGKPIYNAIIWSSKHSKEICDEWKEKGYGDIVKEKTGLPVDPYFSASKIRWILDKCEYEDVSNLYFGTMDSYLCFRLSGGKEHVSDASNASRTMLFNIKTLSYDEELLNLFDIPLSMLPKVVNTCGYKIRVEEERITKGKELYITAIVADQQSSLFGQGCINKGDIKNTYGTGSFILSNTGNEIMNNIDLISTIAWKIDDKVTYAIEGTVFLTGGLIEWLANNLKIITSGSEIADIDINSNGVYFVPALSGLAAPYWDSNIKGAFLGLSLATDRNSIISSVLEAIAYSNKELIELMNKVMHNSINSITVDGGLTLNNSLMKLQSSILSIDVYINTENEATSLGAALLSGLGSGVYKNMDECMKFLKSKKIIKKDRVVRLYNAKYKKWRNAIKVIRKFK